MTIQNFKKKCDQQPGLFDFVSTATEIWSNEACLGYVIRALESLNCPEDQIQDVVNAVKQEFDCTTVDEAEKHYQRTQY